VERVEAQKLLRAYHRDGDLSARDELIEAYLPLVKALARRYVGRQEPLDDLVQVGSIGLIKAIDRFDVDRGVELTTYAIPTIIGELKRHFRDKGWSVHVPRRLKELNLQLSHLMEELAVTLGRSPTVAELAAAAKIEEEEAVEALEVGQVYSALSLSGGDEEFEAEPLASIGVDDPGYEVMEDRALLGPGLDSLDARERRILELRFYDGLTQSQIAADVGISQMHVSRLIRKALATMREELETPEQVGS
jgi:RNA polymerase sigma-B factor